MSKKVISFLLCFCFFISATTVAFGEDTYTFEKIKDANAVLVGKVTKISKDTIKLSKISDALWSDIKLDEAYDYNIKDTNPNYFILNTGRFDEGQFHDGDVIKAYFLYYFHVDRKSANGEEQPYKLVTFQKYEKQVSIEDKAKFLCDLGILNGYDDGQLHLERNITRGEFTALIMKIYFDYECGYYSEVQLTKPFPYQDVPKDYWARKYIELAYLKNIINGKNKDTFSPNEGITINDCITVLIKASAIKMSKENALSVSVNRLGGYPDGYLSIAKESKLISDQLAGKVATREDVIEILYNVYNHEPDVTYTFQARKPVIYLYPEKETDVNVKVSFDGAFTFTYPEYNKGWTVTAKTDGTLVSGTTEYPYLFWEGEVRNYTPVFDEGFLVGKKETISFLEEKLSLLGLNAKERADFITYWGPQLMKNDFNMIKFDTKEYASKVSLNIEPSPDSLIRVFMVYKAANGNESVKEQILNKGERKGFVAVEWGGTTDES